MPTAAIGLGSNIGDAAGNVRSAIGGLRELGTITAVSRLYKTKPVGELEQADFINAAVLLETTLDPHTLLDRLKAMETQLGRRPTYRWGPRVIDLDLLCYDGVHVSDQRLTLPHPRVHERAFVLVPLAEIDPSYKEAAGRVDSSGVTPL